MDIGCGTGQSTENLLPHFEKVYGCDPSQAMLDQAEEDYKNHGKYFNRASTMRRNLLNLYVLVSISKNLRFTVIGLLYFSKR